MSATDYGTCQGCHRPLRASRTRTADAPGTVIAVRTGECLTCYRQEHPKPSRAVNNVPDPTLEAWRIVYEADRRTRGIHPDGIPDDQL